MRYEMSSSSRARRALIAFACLLVVPTLAGRSPAADLRGAADARPRGAADARPRPRGPQCVVELRLEGEIEGVADLGLSSPEALALDHRGHLVIADTGNHRVLIVSREGVVVEEFGGYGWDPGQFDTPSDVAVYPGFYVYVLDEGNRRIQRFDDDGDLLDLTEFGDEGGSPVAIEIGRSGEILVTDADSHTVRAVSQFEEILDPFGQFGVGEGGLARPGRVAAGPGGEIAVADADRGAVEVYDQFGAHLYALTTPDTLTATAVVFDGSGAVLVSDARRGAVLAFPPGGGPPSASFDGASDGMTPRDLAIGGDRLFVLDLSGPRILVLGIVYGDCRGQE